MLRCLLRLSTTTSAHSPHPLYPLLRPLTTTTVEVTPNPETPGGRRRSVYYDGQTDAALKNSNFEMVSRLICSRVEEKCYPNSRTFQHVASPEGLSSLEQLINTLATLDCNNHGKNRAFQCLVASLCKKNRVDESRSVLQAMIDGGFGKNSVAFLPLISNLARKKKMNEVEEIFRWMRASGIVPDVVCHNCVLAVHCVSRRCEKAAEMVRKMEEEGIVPNGGTYDALVVAACRVGRLDAAMNILGRMLDEGVTILYSTYLNILRGFIWKDLFDEGLKFAAAVSSLDRVAGTEAFGFLVRWCKREKWVERERLVLEEMNHRGLDSGVKINQGTMEAEEEEEEEEEKDLISKSLTNSGEV